MRRTAWLLAGVVILLAVGWRLGGGPFLAGLRAVTGRSVLAAVAIAAAGTVAAGWRWRLVAAGLGLRLPLGTAVAAYYRAQLLNTVLPGGVLGDLHRAVRHGRDAGDLARGMRTVGWERTAGQLVQAGLAVVALAVLPSPVPRPVLAGAGLAVLLMFGLVALAAGRRPPAHRPAKARIGAARIVRARIVRVWRIVREDLAELARANWPAMLLASAVAVASHVALFLVAARAAGAGGPTGRLLPLALLALLAMSVPANVGGWGPREGVTAWAFAAAGLGADRGLATATLYGVLVLAGCLPGLAVLAWDWRHQAGRDKQLIENPMMEKAYQAVGHG